MKWYQIGEVAEQLELVMEAFLEGFTNDIEFAIELSQLGLSHDEQIEVIKEEIARQESDLLMMKENVTIHQREKYYVC